LAIYAVIGGRLIMFAVGGRPNHGRAAEPRRRNANLRPGGAGRDIVDRNGRGTRQPTSRRRACFGEPAPDHRQGRGDRASDPRPLPDLDTGEVARPRLSSKKKVLFWLKGANHHAAAAAGDSPARHFPASAFLR